MKSTERQNHVNYYFPHTLYLYIATIILASLKTAETHRTRFLQGVSSRSNIFFKALLEYNKKTQHFSYK